MCGIVGYAGPRDALEILISGLSKLEYRGYDSAGVALLHRGKIAVRRAVGKLSELKRQLEIQPPHSPSHLGIGHTRWATHGKPSESNAHPHTAGRISLIHNGIIENYLEIKARLLKAGRHFHSETDTEIAAQLFDFHLSVGLEPYQAFTKMCGEVRGSYSFLAIDEHSPDTIFFAKNSSPLVIGIGEGEMFLASDIPAILSSTRSVVIIEDGDYGKIHAGGYTIEHNGSPANRAITTISWDPITAQKGGFKHFMLKEIHDQPLILSDTLRGRLDLDAGRVSLPEVNLSKSDIAAIQRIILVGCGTAWHACLMAKYYIESIARIPCEVDYASEFRYRTPILESGTLILAISQSGETADTLGAIELATKQVPTLAICNCLGSSLTRKAGRVLYTQAGPEISVASTKAFTTQVVCSYLLALLFAQERGIIANGALKEHLVNLLRLPGELQRVLDQAPAVQEIAREFQHARDFLFLGRGFCYPIALEGALKLKEISYIHAEGYPAGEMKHGPIALIDEQVPVVVILQRSKLLFDKTLSNLKEVESRDGKIIAITDAEDCTELRRVARAVVEVPYLSDELSPVLLNIPQQLLSYYIAVANGTDVDLPRNLAKSVTVE